MPELPDVEGFRRLFARRAAGERVEAVQGVDRALLRGTTPQGLGRGLKGRRLAEPDRRGKLLICPSDGPTLLIHFGMTGSLVWDEPPHRHDRLTLELGDGALRLRDMRRFSRVWLARDEDERARIVGRLGPDWLDVDRERFEELLAGRRGTIKPALMDQALAAGLGNLTADEALWRARIDPRRPVSSLDQEARGRLHRAIRKVLRESLPHGRVPAKRGWLTSVRDEREAVCPRCGARLERATAGGRTSVLCPREQS